jgi:hypothetical protein
MASALLTVACPARFTVFDFRAMMTLRECGELDDSWPLYDDYRLYEKHWYYTKYVALRQQICRRVCTDLRILDRALWAWSQAASFANSSPPLSVKGFRSRCRSRGPSQTATWTATTPVSVSRQMRQVKSANHRITEQARRIRPSILPSMGHASYR